MKKYALLLAIIIPLVLMSCIQKTKIAEPGLSIYKTNYDYFDYTTCRMRDGKIVSYYAYKGEQDELSSRAMIIDGDTISSNRFRLTSGYIVDAEGDEIMVFLDLTLKEHMKLERENGGPLTSDILKQHILDSSPFTEYYEESNPKGDFFYDYRKIDTIRLNEIIKSGELEKHFTKKK